MMIKRIVTAIILLTIFAGENAFSQAQLGSTNGIQFTYEDMKVYKTYQDFVDHNFVVADFMDKKNFKKDKKKILDVAECWGYTVDDNSSTYTFRICDDAEYKTVLMTIRGSLCLYADGTPYFNPKKSQLFVLFNNFTEPTFFSVGDTGVIQKFNKANISEAVKNDGTITAQANGIKNVSSNGQEYIWSRIHLVQAYNKRHQSSADEFDLFAPPSRESKKK